MAIKDIFTVNRKTFFNPKASLGYDTIKRQARLIVDIGKDTFIPVKPERQETFEEAMQRLNLTEDDIKSSEENYLIYSLIFVALGAIAFSASFILLFYYNTLSGFLMGLGATALLLTQAFRFHFWHFQIKYRKLGCTFEEWKRGKPFDNGKPTS